MRNWLKLKREQRKMTQTDVARQVGITQPAYFNIETGARNPSVSVAKKIASVLKFDWTLFFENEKK